MKRNSQTFSSKLKSGQVKEHTQVEILHTNVKQINNSCIDIYYCKSLNVNLSILFSSLRYLYCISRKQDSLHIWTFSLQILVSDNVNCQTFETFPRALQCFIHSDSFKQHNIQHCSNSKPTFSVKLFSTCRLILANSWFGFLSHCLCTSLRTAVTSLTQHTAALQ